MNFKMDHSPKCKIKKYRIPRKKSLQSWTRQRILREDTKDMNQKKLVKLDFIKIQNFCFWKDTIKKTKMR